MLPKKYDFQIYRGDYFTKEFRFYDLDLDGNKIPIDLTGAIVKSQVRESTDIKAKLIFEFSIGVFENIITITLLPSQTQLIEPGSYVYDLQVNDNTKLFGKIKIIGDITR